MIMCKQIGTTDLIHVTIEASLKLGIFMYTLSLRDVILLVTTYFCFTHVQQCPPCFLFLCDWVWACFGWGNQIFLAVLRDGCADPGEAVHLACISYMIFVKLLTGVECGYSA